MNGVCVRFRGWIDLERLDGIGCLEYDERRGSHEDAILKEQLERYNQRLRDFEDSKQRTTFRPERTDDFNAQMKHANSSSTIGVGGARGNWRQ